MNIYFAGIGGVGIGPLAEIAHDAHYGVQGSDQHAGLMTRELERRGIPIAYEQDGSFLRQCHQRRPIDWVVYSAALPADHPELVTAQALGIKIAKRDELIAHLITDKNLKLIAVAGTHGKTTTTGMLIWLFQQLGLPVSYSVGTTLNFGPSGRFDPTSQYFIYECDEFDRNFLHFHPYLSLLTSLDYDHPDTYPTEEDYRAAFATFISQSDHTIMWQHDTSRLPVPSASTWQLRDDEISSLSLPGAHNRRNATLVVKATDYLGLETAELVSILERFPGTNRRFERLGELLYSDYGHHPVEIAATLQLARELSDHVVLVYQPHQNVRQHEIHNQYTNAIFEAADDVYWVPTYLSREDETLPILTPTKLTTQLTDIRLHIAELDAELWSAVQQHRDAGHLVLCMGAGSIDNWARENEQIKKVANVLVTDTQGNFILQQRDMTPGITNPGMITGFGGAVEGDEPIRAAALRELTEETNLRPESGALHYLTTVFQERVNDGTPRWVSYFTLAQQPIDTLEVYEGAGYAIVSPQDDLDTINLSPTVRQALRYYLAHFPSA